MLGTARKTTEQREALERIKAWTRARFALPDDVAIVVAELVCGLPGCPPLETVVAFWTADGTRHRFKLFKPVTDVDENDVPYAWLLDALAAPDGYDTECC